MPDIPTMSLKTVQFNPTVFTPSQYEYQAADMNILERSLAQREARMKEAAQSKSAMDIKLGEVETKLNPAEAEWFESYKQNIGSQIQASIDSGDYGAAIRNAQYLAGKIAQDPRLLGRIRSQEAYNEELKTQQARRDKGEIGQNTYDWWVSKNTYNYTDTKDANGNYVESSPWQAESRPVDDINWAGQAMAAFKMITPHKGTTVRENIPQGSSSTESREFVRIEDIRKNIERMLSATTDGYRQAEQAFDVAKFDLKRMEQKYAEMSDDNPDKADLLQKIEKRRQLMRSNGVMISYEEYYARMVTDELYSQGLAYDWRTDKQGSSPTADNYPSVRMPYMGGEVNTNYYPRNNFFTKGANVRWDLTYNLGTLNSATFGIQNRFSVNQSITKRFSINPDITKDFGAQIN